MTDPRSPGWRLAAADLSGLRAAFLDNPSLLEERLAQVLAARDIVWFRHRFSPGGASIVGVGSETRVVAHTWPESGALTLDVWSTSDPVGVLDAVLRGLGASSNRTVSAQASHDALE